MLLSFQSAFYKMMDFSFLTLPGTLGRMDATFFLKRSSEKCFVLEPLFAFILTFYFEIVLDSQIEVANIVQRILMFPLSISLQ